MITLFGNLESGNVHKVQMILRRVGIPYCRVEVSQVRGEPRQPEFLKINPMGKVPAVQLDDGDVLTESGALLYWFGHDTPLWPNDERRRVEVLRWMFFEQYSHEPTLAVLRYLRRFAPDPSVYATRMAELATKAHQALHAMQTCLESGAWIAGATCTLADFALYPYTKWADEAGIELRAYPAVLRWLSDVEHEPGFIPLRIDGSVSTVSFEEYFGTSRR
jgi:glutathione S-transferase